MHFSDDLQINDFGFLSRNNLNYAHWQVMKRITDMPEGVVVLLARLALAHQRLQQRPWPGPAAPVPHERVQPAARTAATTTRRSTSTAPATTIASCAATAFVQHAVRTSTPSPRSNWPRQGAWAFYAQLRHQQRRHRRRQQRPQARLEHAIQADVLHQRRPEPLHHALRRAHAAVDALAGRQPARHVQRTRRSSSTSA